ncbi:MAG TPA: biotin carboxylase N-terminal domain-containing protein [Thermoanaerobaculia bacterium]
MRLLVANRGEIAVRIFRACRDLGIETVAVFSDADRAAPHVAMADYAVRLGPAPARESYLSIDRLLEAARTTSANLIHPGYGFLAESAPFARACREGGFLFVGPSPEVIESMGAKTVSRQRMTEAGVPVVPGMLSPAASAAEIGEFARRAGYPILLKASAGGGGKGMRRVDGEAELAAAFERASAEAQMYFGDGAVYAEKLVENPRHIEVQIVGDRRGGAVALGERECSLQRRHQKVVEECPSPVVTPEIRSRLSDAALAAARAVGYDSCGTVEFLLAPDSTFYFLEMNTRLQVEHPVTEAVWGVDLAAEMIRVALGDSLSEEVRRAEARGHAIECRIYAEDPARGFAPSPGTITALRQPSGPGVRADMGVEAGSVVPLDYDPMLGKLIVHGKDRAQAIARLGRALLEFEILGVDTTLPLFRWLLGESDFVSARFDVQWLDRRLEGGAVLERSGSSADEVVLAAVALASEAAGESGSRPDASHRSAWRQAGKIEGLRGS